jgi:hypothetical protein
MRGFYDKFYALARGMCEKSITLQPGRQPRCADVGLSVIQSYARKDAPPVL